MAIAEIAKHLLDWLERGVEKLAQPSPPRFVTIGTVSRYDKVAASIRAEVKHPRQRWHQPDVDTFLERVRLGPLYCHNCKSTLALWETQEGGKLGLTCRVCSGVHARTEDIQWLEFQLTGEIRAHYADYWARYQQATASWVDSFIVKTWVKWRSPRGPGHEP